MKQLIYTRSLGLALFIALWAPFVANSQVAYYLRSNTGNPWGSTTNDAEMTTVFGGTWTLGFFETPGIAATVFVPSRQVVMLDGSDFGATELETFLTANMATIENWVFNGGRLFLNSAPNEDNGMSYGFGGTNLVYQQLIATSSTPLPAHPVHNGPNVPATPPITGNWHAHSYVTGTGLTVLMHDQGNPAFATVAYKTWGCGVAAFGGITTSNWHTPVPNAANWRANLLNWLLNTAGTNSILTGTLPNQLCPGQTLNVPFTYTEVLLCGAPFTGTWQVELSTASGTFPGTMLTINSLTVGSGTGTANVTIPAGITTYSASYVIRVNNTIPATLGSNSNTLQIGFPGMDLVNAGNDTSICPGNSAQLNGTLPPGGILCPPPPAAYAISTIGFAPVSFVAPTSVTLGDDQTSAAFNIGFSFPYFCTNYTQFVISSNGFISFNLASWNGCCTGQALPNATYPNIIAAYWEDIYPPGGGTIRYETQGTAPNRRLIVEWANIPHYFNNFAAPVTTQIVLYETTGIIEIYSANCTSDGGLHTQGINNPAGTQAFFVAGRNSANFSMLNDAVRFTPAQAVISFVWSPGATLSGTTIEDPVATPTATTTYTLSVTGNGCTVQDQVVVSTAPNLTWTGSTNTNWHVNTNWFPQCLPTCASDVTIPNVTNDPVIFTGNTGAARNVTLQSTAQLTFQNNSILEVCGNYVNQGSIFDAAGPTGGTIRFIGTAPQSYSHAGSPQWSFRNVVVNTNGQLTLNSNLEVQPFGSLTFGGTAAGQAIVTTGANTVLMNTPGTINNTVLALPATQNYNFVNGNFRWMTGAGQTTYSFPVGNLAHGLQEMRLTRNNTATDGITRLDAFYQSVPPPIPGVNPCGVNGTWVQTPYPGKFTFHANGLPSYTLPAGSTYELNMRFRGALPAGPYWGILIDHGTGWNYARVNSGPVPLSCVQPPAATPLTAPLLAAFSEGSGIGNSQPFPVEMLPLTANPETNSIRLDWAVQSQNNNAGFEVQRRVGSSESFSQLGFVEGHGTLHEEMAYSYRDETVQPGIRFQYRLRQMDLDGAFTFSNTVEAVLTDNGLMLSVYPNPTDGKLFVGFNAAQPGHYSWQLLNTTGQVVLSSPSELTHPAGSTHVPLDLRGTSAGTYFLRLTTQSGTQQFPVVVAY